MLALLSRVRWFDRDEGFYAMAAALIRAGRHPWRDFAYPQGPLLPFLLAPFGSDILALRWISVGALLLVSSDSDRWSGRGRSELRGPLAGLLIGAATAIRLPCVVLAPLAVGWLGLHGPPI